MAPHRILVVEDHEPFRRVMCALLQQRADMSIVGEACDGLEAVHRAEALQPDVVMLDLGLPSLNGVEAAGRIRAVAPDAKLLIVTNEVSLDVVEEAFRRGAHGYVYKPRAQRDLLHVIEAVLRGGRFVSSGLERIARGDSLTSHRHDVLFYPNEAIFANVVSHFIAGARKKGSAVIALVTESHGECLHGGLEASDVDLDRAVQQGRYTSLSISALLSKVMVNCWPDPTRFLNAVRDAVVEAGRRATSQPPRVAACCECSPTLWADGHVEAAIQLEHLWDEVARSQPVDLLCAYPIATRQENARLVRSLCAEHTAVEIC
jgi:DNA-binding NarL/FixJ family response regulator